jgi:hypothetical protein
MRGFKDREEGVETFAGTTSRTGQRITNTAIVQDPDFVLFSFDVSQAFAKGMTFEEYARLTGAPLREVEFEVRPEDVPLIRRLPGFEDFDPAKEVLKMLKSIYGLKDAPRAWRKRLHQVLVEFGLTQLHAEPEVYVCHEAESHVAKTTGDTAARRTQIQPETIEEKMVRERAAEQEVPHSPPERWLTNTRLKLKIVLSTHVDDLKGGARKEVAEALLKHLELRFGPCKNEWKSFMHTGVQHELTADGLFCHQWKYISQLKPLVLGAYKGKDDQDLAPEMAGPFVSLLGGAAWTVLTRGDLAVYIQALQRRGGQPRITDCRKLNLVVRFLGRHKIGVMYRRLDGDIRLLGFSDSAFKAQEDEGSGLAIRGLAVLLAADVRPGEPILCTNKTYNVHLLEWLVRRLRRVVRSTFAAELNALTDSIESLILIQLALHQIFCGTHESADQLLLKLEHGALYPPIDLFVDAKSVSDALAAADCCTPQESSLKTHLITIRDRLCRGLVRSVSWTDTRDMIADCLTKGGIDRAMMHAAMLGRVKFVADVVTQHGKQRVI